jgi:pimeloyl-ACP methyl ester carboxylesterase
MTCFLLLLACRASPPEPADSSGPTDTGTPPPAIDWAPCPLYVDQPDGPAAECATIEVPLRWSEPDGPTIGIFVQRRLGADARGQLWLLEGGPGGSGADFDATMELLGTLDPGLDVYAVDHRGVGRSARLTCAEQETVMSPWGVSISPDEAAACAASLEKTWGDDLGEFTATAAARDLAFLIDAAHEPDKDVFVYGVSYGTYWAHRYLQVAPDQATAVVLDSIAPPGIDFAQYDTDFDAVGHDYFDLCAKDALCASKLGPDPWARTHALIDALPGHCSSLTSYWGLDQDAMRLVLGYLLLSPATRTYMPALVYRLERCDDGDVDAIGTLLTALFGGSSAPSYYTTLSSDALFYNVSLSELWSDDPPTEKEVDATEDTLAVSTALTQRVAGAQDAWPAYARDEYADAWADTDTPMLMMNGDLDPQTPIWLAESANDHLASANHWFFTIPRSAHCVIYETPTNDTTGCGMEMFLDFLQDPSEPPDASCYSGIPEESFTGDPKWNTYFFGTTDLWENESKARHLGPTPPLPDLEDRVKRAIAARR